MQAQRQIACCNVRAGIAGIPRESIEGHDMLQHMTYHAKSKAVFQPAQTASYVTLAWPCSTWRPEQKLASSKGS